MSKGLRVVALLEAFKGLLALAAAFELHKLAGRNVQQAFETMAAHLHLNPAVHLPGLLALDIHDLTDQDFTLVATGAAIYAVVRFVEAYGLWHALLWTEWFAIVSGSIYIPFEVYEVIFKTSWASVIALTVNIGIVWYIYSIVRGNRHSPRG